MSDDRGRPTAGRLRGAPGLDVGPYTLVRFLGAGGFGEVWEACHRDLEQLSVALKLPHGPEQLAQLRRDGVVQHRLDAREIVRVLGMDLGAALPYLAYELVRGRTLAERIVPGPLALDDALGIAADLSRALAHAHERGILHLDLKPTNVLVDGLGRARVTDFGLAAAVRGSSGPVLSAGLASGRRRDGGALVGTLAYMAPEQRQGAIADARADVHALGVVLFEALTGRLPSGYELPSRVRPDLPLSIDALYRSLVAGLADRLPDGAAAARAIAATALGLCRAPVRWTDRVLSRLGP